MGRRGRRPLRNGLQGRTTLSAQPDNAALCRAGPACPAGAVEKRIPRSRLCRDLGDGGCGCPCCGAQNFCAALRQTLEILTAATHSPRFLCHWQRSVRSPRARCALAMTHLCTLCTHHIHYYLYIGKMGAAKDLLKEDFEDGKARKENRGDFLRRTVEEGYQVFEGKSAAYGYRPVRRESAGENARQVQNIM